MGLGFGLEEVSKTENLINVNKCAFSVFPNSLCMVMDQRINSAVYDKVLNEPMNFPLSVSPSMKEMGHHTRQRKKSPTSAGTEPHDLTPFTLGLGVAESFDFFPVCLSLLKKSVK